MQKKLFSCLILLFFINPPVCASADILLKKIDGSSFSFSSLKGKWVFINYWASWCNPCLNEIAALNTLHASKSNKMEVFAVNFDPVSLADQQLIAKKFSINYPSLDQTSLTKLQLGDISVIPITFVFNPHGQLAAKLYGEQTIKSLEQIITDQEQLLK